MARLEQYTIDNFSLGLSDGETGIQVFENPKNGQLMFDELRIEHVDTQGKSARLIGRAALSDANFVIRMSRISNDGFMTLSYSDDVHPRA